jgi:hypothetical protein
VAPTGIATKPPVLPGIPREPDWDELPDERVRHRAQSEWQRVTTILDQGYMLASSDLIALHGAVVAYASWRVALMDNDIGMAQRWLRIALNYATKCGLTPADRLRLDVPATPQSDPYGILD